MSFSTLDRLDLCEFPKKYRIDLLDHCKQTGLLNSKQCVYQQSAQIGSSVMEWSDAQDVFAVSLIQHEYVVSTSFSGGRHSCKLYTSSSHAALYSGFSFNIRMRAWTARSPVDPDDGAPSTISRKLWTPPFSRSQHDPAVYLLEH